MKKTKLTDLPVASTVEINGFDYEYRGRDKKNLGFGKVECFVSYSEKLKSERTFELHKFLKHELKSTNNKYIF